MTTETTSTPSDPEDAKIITLARSALARTSAPQGACVRDTDGRTYAASSVALDAPDAVGGRGGGRHGRLVGRRRGSRPSPWRRTTSRTRTRSTPTSTSSRDLAGDGVAVWATDPRGVVRGRVLT